MILLILWSLTLTIGIDAARILAVLPTPSKSHQIVFRPLINELVNRGHEVVLITTDPAFPPGQSPINLTEIDVHNVSYATWQDSISDSYTAGNENMYQQSCLFIKMFAKIVEKQLQTQQVRNIINNKHLKFDLLILEGIMRATLGFSHVFKAPVIQISSNGPVIGTYSIVGAPTHPLLYPIVPQHRIYNLSFWEKVEVLYYNTLAYHFYTKHEIDENEMMRKYFGADTPPLSELYNNVDMYFHSVHPIWLDNSPVPPSVVYVGGIHQKPPNQLPKNLKSFLDSSKNGVIYVSLGSNVKPSFLSANKIEMMTKVLSELPYEVLWKWDKGRVGDIAKNIRTSTWFPQQDVLSHPKVKLVITQGGLQSTEEAIYAGVPLVGMPLFGDQWFNCEKYVHHRIGEKLSWNDLTEEQFRRTIVTVISNDSYRHNILRLRTIMNDQPQSPLERAIWWTEHVLRHGGARHLRAPAANMSWRDYYELDLVLILITGFIACVFMLCLSMYYLWRYVIFSKCVMNIDIKKML